MSVKQTVLMRTFGRPHGLLGRLGGKVMARGFRDVAAWAISLSTFAPDDHVLEVGFGPGVGIELLTSAVPEGAITGVDPSREMFEQASKRNAAAIRSGQVELRSGTAENLPFDDETFDAALSLNSLPAWSDRRKGLREVHRVLKPGGTITLAFAPQAPQPADELPGSLQEAGFENVHVETRAGDVCAMGTA